MEAKICDGCEKVSAETRWDWFSIEGMSPLGFRETFDVCSPECGIRVFQEKIAQKPEAKTA